MMTHLFAWALVEESNGKFCERGSTWIGPWRQVWPFPVCEVGKYLTVICEQKKAYRSIYFILAYLWKAFKSKVIDLISKQTNPNDHKDHTSIQIEKYACISRFLNMVNTYILSISSKMCKLHHFISKLSEYLDKLLKAVHFLQSFHSCKNLQNRHYFIIRFRCERDWDIKPEPREEQKRSSKF